MHRVETEEFKTKNVFKKWKEDNADTHTNIFKTDYELTMIEDLIKDRDETKKIKNEIVCVLPELLDIFHILQA